MTKYRPWSRRTVPKGALAAGALSPVGIWPKVSLAADAPLTPACRDEHQVDRLFRPQLLMSVSAPELKSVQFTFVVDA